MPKSSKSSNNNNKKLKRPARTPEARINQLIAASINLAEKQILEGTASSQVITHFLRLAANRDKEKLEIEKLKEENELLKAKTENLKSAKRVEQLYTDALNAMRIYSGNRDD